MFRSPARRLVIAAVTLLLASACTSTTEDAPPDESPPDLSAFHEQTVAFEPCAPYATTAVDEELFADERLECARVRVPLDYADPEGASGEVALLRIRAGGERDGEKIGSLLVNPGGPGGSGMNFVAAMAASNPMWTEGAIGQRFDVVGFDPRGAGASLPRVDCFTDEEEDREEGFHAALETDVVPDAEAAAEVARRCAESVGGDEALAGVSTRDIARDMDVLRAVLGDEKLTYLGYSYGTELGGAYAEAFPDRVRAMVLDGAVDPKRSADELMVAQAAAGQEGFDRLAEECAAEADCPLGGDPARSTEEFQALTRPLRDEPAPTADGRGLGYDLAITGTLAGLRSESLRGQLVEALGELAEGRGDGLLALSDLINDRGPDGRYRGLMDAFTAVRCMDWPRSTPEELAERGRRMREVAPILDDGRPVGEDHHVCEAWPAPPTRSGPYASGEVDLPPTLTVSVTGDPATPHQGGINLAEALGGSLLTVDGAQHGAALTKPHACIDEIVVDYLVALETPPDGARCEL
ncbi:alpha/beta hydrolase [Streptomyces sedi]|uniref:Alpha/beta hydrolase n=1 Tax=Streptomyces sedi TaxID=555059 RepID=A0A5C4UUR9_9ACTN|nr:alpha/beta hydrolase [Streptomyces sedi]TNM27248.1 alpha/beta hydrolase [Streptomyces sedi]